MASITPLVANIFHDAAKLPGVQGVHDKIIGPQEGSGSLSENQWSYLIEDTASLYDWGNAFLDTEFCIVKSSDGTPHEEAKHITFSTIAHAYNRLEL